MQKINESSRFSELTKAITELQENYKNTEELVTELESVVGELQAALATLLTTKDSPRIEISNEKKIDSSEAAVVSPAEWSQSKEIKSHESNKWTLHPSSEKLLLDRSRLSNLISFLTDEQKEEIKQDGLEVPGMIELASNDKKENIV